MMRDRNGSLMLIYFIVALMVYPSLSTSNNNVKDQPFKQVNKLTLAAAMTQALSNSPMYKAARDQAEADQARSDSRWDGTPNPELTVEAEDFLGTGAAQSVDGMQVTATVSKEVELGRKADKRRKMRTLQKDISAIQYELSRQNVLADVAMAFLDVLAEQARLEHAMEMVRLSQKTVDTISAQVEAGRSTGMEKEKALVELALSRLAERDATRAFSSAKVRLAAACGNDSLFFMDVSGNLDSEGPLPRLDDLLVSAKQHPEMLTIGAKIRHQQAVVNAEKARQIPNVTIGLGYRWNNASSNHALVAGIGVPIPLLDRNKGQVNGAAKEVQKIENEATAQRLELSRNITTGYHTLEYELQRLKVLKNEIRPGVADTYAAVEEGYRIGRFGYLDLLDAQRTLFDVEDMVLDALVKYQTARIQLNRTAGVPISENMFANSQTSSKETP